MDILHKTLLEKKQRFASIISMSDWTECYYSTQYIKKKGNKQDAIDFIKIYEKGNNSFFDLTSFMFFHFAILLPKNANLHKSPIRTQKNEYFCINKQSEQ